MFSLYVPAGTARWIPFLIRQQVRSSKRNFYGTNPPKLYGARVPPPLEALRPTTMGEAKAADEAWTLAELGEVCISSRLDRFGQDLVGAAGDVHGVQARLSRPKKIVDRRLACVATLCRAAVDATNLGGTVGNRIAERALVVLPTVQAAKVAKPAIEDHLVEKFGAKSFIAGQVVRNLVSRDVVGVVRDRFLAAVAEQKEEIKHDQHIPSSTGVQDPTEDAEETTDVGSGQDRDETSSKASVVVVGTSERSVVPRRGSSTSEDGSSPSEGAFATADSNTDAELEVPPEKASSHAPAHRRRHTSSSPVHNGPRIVVAALDELPNDCCGAFSRVVLCGLSQLERERAIRAVQWERDKVEVLEVAIEGSLCTSEDHSILGSGAVSSSQLQDMITARHGQRASFWSQRNGSENPRKGLALFAEERREDEGWGPLFSTNIVGAEVPLMSLSLRSWVREKTRVIYQQHKPDKLSDLERNLAKYVGREDLMYLKICRKYNVAVDAEVYQVKTLSGVPPPQGQLQPVSPAPAAAAPLFPVQAAAAAAPLFPVQAAAAAAPLFPVPAAAAPLFPAPAAAAAPPLFGPAP